MKIKSIILSAFAALAFASCSNENNSTNGNTDVDNVAKQGYLTLSLTSPATKSFRTTGNSTQESVTSNDSKINSVTVLLVSPEGTENAGKILQVYPNSDFTPGQTPSSDHSFRVNIGQYEVYAIVNPSGVFANSFQVGASIEQVLSLAEESAATAINGYASSSNGFLMINARNEANVTAGIPVTITTQNTVSKPASVSIHVDRLVAALKLSKTDPTVQFTQNTDDGTPSVVLKSAKVLGFLPLYARKDFNSIQKWKSLDGTAILNNPSASVTADSPSTKNFYNTAEDLLNYDDDKVAISSKVTTTDFNSLFYVLENRPEMVKVDSVYTSYNVGTTGVVFAVQALNLEGENKTFYKVSKSNKYFYNIESAIAERNSLYSDQLATDTTDPATLRAKGIRVYEDGLVYYTYYIKDNNYSFEQLHYNAVHRNSIYDLKVNNLFSIGDDLPGGNIPDPNKPELIIDTYLSVAISINNWVLDTHEIDL